MSDLVAKLRLEASGGAQAAGEVERVEDALDAVAPAADRAGQGARRAGSEFGNLGNAADRVSVDLADLYDTAQKDFVGSWSLGAGQFAAGGSKVQASAKLTGNEMLNLSRQFADVGVTAAMGMNPLMILVQQGPQIAETFGTAAARGLTFSQVLKSIAVSGWAAVAPLAPFIAGAAAVAAVIGGSAALAARALTNENKNLVASLGLTEKQMERLKEKGVDTGVTIGDVFKGTFNYLATAAKPLLEPIGKFFDELFDKITRGLVATVKTIVGGFAGAFEAVKATWRMLPAAIGDVAVSAANAVIASIERMINGAIASYNKLLPIVRGLMAATGNIAGGSALQVVGSINLGRLANGNAGAAADLGNVAKDAYQRGDKAGRAAFEGVIDGWTASVLSANKKRLTDAAGDADPQRKARTGTTPRDSSDQRTAQIDQMIERALQEELQVRLSLTDDVRERASLQKQIIAAELATKKAQLAGVAAGIARDKGLTDAEKAQYAAQLKLVEEIQLRTAAALERRVDEETSAEISRQRVELETAQREAQIDLLGAQADLTRSAYARNLIEAEILKAQQAIERSKLEEVIASAASSEHEKALAQARLSLLGQIHAAEQAQIGQQTRLIDAVTEAEDAASGFKDALRREDWGKVFEEFRRTIETVQAAFRDQGLVGGSLAAASAAATVIGGKTGRTVSNSIALYSAAAPLVGAPIAAAAAALYAAAKLLNVGGKPTNAGAGVNLVTGEITGNKRTTETENAAKAAAASIKSIQDLFAEAGINLTTTVNGLVLGTRDQTQVYLSNGKTLTTAVGNVQAAIDAATRGILEGATYQSETQKKLVEDMVAAGKGFEDIKATLDSFKQAQSLVGQIDDAILQLTDPKAWGLEELKRNQQAQRDALKAAADAGFYTAAEFEAASAKLAKLEDLQTAAKLKELETAASGAADALNLQKSVSDRILELTNPTAAGAKRINDEIDARIAEAQPMIASGQLGPDFLAQIEQLRGLELQAYFASLAEEVDETGKAFKEARPRLLTWLDELRAGAGSELSPKGQREEALKQYQRELGKAQGGDPTSISNILAYADRLLEADKNATSSASARQALRDQVMGQIEGLAGRGAEASPAAAISALQVPLNTIAQASAADLAAASAGGKVVAIGNLPSMQAMYGTALSTQTDRLVAANDRNAQEIVASLKALAESQAANMSALAEHLDGALQAVAAGAASQASQIAAGLGEIAAETRLAEASRRFRTVS